MCSRAAGVVTRNARAGARRSLRACPAFCNGCPARQPSFWRERLVCFTARRSSPQPCRGGTVRAPCALVHLAEAFLTLFSAPSAEGNVYYTDQNAAFNEEEDRMTKHESQRQFVEFLRNFRGTPEPGNPVGTLIYRDQLEQDPPPVSLTVSLDDIIDHNEELGRHIKVNPTEFIPSVRLQTGLCSVNGGSPHTAVFDSVFPRKLCSWRTLPQTSSSPSAPRSRTAMRPSARKYKSCSPPRARSGKCAASRCVPLPQTQRTFPAATPRPSRETRCYVLLWTFHTNPKAPLS